jgi:hypothetical protein
MDPPLLLQQKPNRKPIHDAEVEVTETMSACAKRLIVFTNKQDMCRGSPCPKHLGVMPYSKDRAFSLVPQKPINWAICMKFIHTGRPR